MKWFASVRTFNVVCAVVGVLSCSMSLVRAESSDADVEEDRPGKFARHASAEPRARLRAEPDDADVETGRTVAARQAPAFKQGISSEDTVVYDAEVKRIAPPREISESRESAPKPREAAPAPRAMTLEPRPEPVPQKAAVVHVIDSNFQAEIGTYKGPVLIDVYSKLCGPCIRTAPIIDSLAEEFRGRVKVIKVDSAQAPAVVEYFNVSSLPCIIMMNNGHETRRTVGLPTRTMLQGWMQAGQ